MQPRTLKAISLLLHYPDQALLDHLSEVQAVTETETALQPGRLAALYQHLGQGDLYLLEENYVALFDRGRGTSLYLFEHVHGVVGGVASVHDEWQPRLVSSANVVSEALMLPS